MRYNPNEGKAFAEYSLHSCTHTQYRNFPTGKSKEREAHTPFPHSYMYR